MIKVAMNTLGKDFPIVLSIHDELVVEVKKADAKKTMKELKGVMEKAASYCTGIPGLIEANPFISMSLSKLDKI
jgi:DNA polymerase I-like protein with 3'-5' exonuclease and polymerase domains